MRLSHKLLLTLLALYPAYANDSFAASRTSSSKSSSNRRVTGNSAEQTKQECITKYIAALDLECYNSNNTIKGGVYSDCSDRTIPDLYDVMDMRLADVVDYKDFQRYAKTCPSYKGEAFSKWTSAKNTVEQSAVKGSGECIHYTNRLNAAKKCYSAALAHDGNFFEFEQLMNSNCGIYPDIAQKFAKAGDLGLSNIPKMLENYSTLQFTNKSANWRNAIEAVFAGYLYEARQYCGEENYDTIQLNNFDPDTRENLLTATKKGFATQFGEQLGSRTENLLSTGQATVGYPVDAKQKIAKDSISSKTTSIFYSNMGWDDSIEVGNAGKITTAQNNAKFGNTTPQINGLYLVKDIYFIENIPNLSNARARLTNIIKNGDMGTYLTQDTLDQTIANALGARSINDSAIYSILGNMGDGDTFIIKDRNNKCSVLTIKDGNVIKLSSSDVNKMAEIYNYVNNCVSVE